MEEQYNEILNENKILQKLQERFKSDSYDLTTAEYKKNALGSNDNKIMQTLDGGYPDHPKSKF